jgi:biotin synthase
LNRGAGGGAQAGGADGINHNLETSRRFYATYVSAHTYDDRLATLHNARRAGLQLCCGGLIGMGEEPEDRVDLAFTLRELAPESIPVNFFNPRPGTPLADRPPLGAADCLRALAMFRLVNPRSDIRAAGGRETNLGPLQGLAFTRPVRSLRKDI